jgi:hypothetical protein
MSILGRWRNWAYGGVRRTAAEPGATFSGPQRDGLVPLEDQLAEPTTVERAERDHTRRDEDLGEADRRSPKRLEALLKPFGFRNAEWEVLKASMQPTDELWTFSSPPAAWQALAGRAGIALVRQGKVVATIITLMN